MQGKGEGPFDKGKGTQLNAQRMEQRLTSITTDEIQGETQIKDNEWVLKGVSSLSPWCLQCISYLSISEVAENLC